MRRLYFFYATPAIYSLIYTMFWLDFCLGTDWPRVFFRYMRYTFNFSVEIIFYLLCFLGFLAVDYVSDSSLLALRVLLSFWSILLDGTRPTARDSTIYWFFCYSASHAFFLCGVLFLFYSLFLRVAFLSDLIILLDTD